MKLYAKIPQEEVIYKGKIRKTGNGQGYVYMNDQYLGYRAYIIFPKVRIRWRKLLDNN